MVHPQVEDGGDGLYIWIAVNILNKQSRRADTGWPSSMGLTIPHHKKSVCYKMFNRASDLDRFFGMT
jgi:hypothetical protein